MDTEALRQGHERMFTFFKETFKTSPWKIITSCSINMHFTFFQYIATKWPDLTHDDYLFKSSLLISVIGIPKVKFRNGSEMADYCDRMLDVAVCDADENIRALAFFVRGYPKDDGLLNLALESELEPFRDAMTALSDSIESSDPCFFPREFIFLSDSVLDEYSPLFKQTITHVSNTVIHMNPGYEIKPQTTRILKYQKIEDAKSVPELDSRPEFLKKPKPSSIMIGRRTSMGSTGQSSAGLSTLKKGIKYKKETSRVKMMDDDSVIELIKLEEGTKLNKEVGKETKRLEVEKRKQELEIKRQDARDKKDEEKKRKDDARKEMGDELREIKRKRSGSMNGDGENGEESSRRRISGPQKAFDGPHTPELHRPHTPDFTRSHSQNNSRSPVRQQYSPHQRSRSPAHPEYSPRRSRSPVQRHYSPRPYHPGPHIPDSVQSGSLSSQALPNQHPVSNTSSNDSISAFDNFRKSLSENPSKESTRKDSERVSQPLPDSVTNKRPPSPRYDERASIRSTSPREQTIRKAPTLRKQSNKGDTIPQDEQVRVALEKTAILLPVDASNQTTPETRQVIFEFCLRKNIVGLMTRELPLHLIENEDGSAFMISIQLNYPTGEWKKVKRKFKIPPLTT